MTCQNRCRNRVPAFLKKARRCKKLLIQKQLSRQLCLKFSTQSLAAQAKADPMREEDLRIPACRNFVELRRLQPRLGEGYHPMTTQGRVGVGVAATTFALDAGMLLTAMNRPEAWRAFISRGGTALFGLPRLQLVRGFGFASPQIIMASLMLATSTHRLEEYETDLDLFYAEQGNSPHEACRLIQSYAPLANSINRAYNLAAHPAETAGAPAVAAVESDATLRNVDATAQTSDANQDRSSTHQMNTASDAGVRAQ